MNMDWLAFLAEPSFVITWYGFGVVAAAWVLYDVHVANTPLKQAIKWAWPIIVVFFSIIGLALYFLTARAPGISRTSDAEEKQRLHAAYEKSMFRRVNGAVIHCVAGDGLGIMSALGIARVLELSFWQEYWFEYLVGYAFGWFIFQYKSMTMMTDDPKTALWMAFRAEFFSMLTVMGGMGAVMTFVTPLVVGMQPKPTTAAFWGFGMLGLLVGYVMTFPMNWMLIKIGWKHGMGPARGAKAVDRPVAKRGLMAAMIGLGALALALPAWLAVVRMDFEREVARGGSSSLITGLAADMQAASRYLSDGERSKAAASLDGALRVSEVAKAAQLPQAERGMQAVREARRALQNNATTDALEALEEASSVASLQVERVTPPPSDVGRYSGVKLLDARGAPIGEVLAPSGGRVRVALGGARDVWGVIDLPPAEVRTLPATQLVFGPRRTFGKSYVVLPDRGGRSGSS